MYCCIDFMGLYFTPMPYLIVLRGPIGAGKTSLLHSLADILPNSSVIEVDALKRMLDPHSSSSWRRETAFEVALIMAKRALATGRNIIAETHSKQPEQQQFFSQLALDTPGSIYKSVLVTAPLNVCKKRSQARHVPGIHYSIDVPMVESYYTGLDPLPEEVVIDTNQVSPQLGALMIIKTLITSKE
jgi:predicted kinase